MNAEQRSRTSCLSCCQRKTKCDKKLPSCSQCANAGSCCPGYSKRWRFRGMSSDGRNNNREAHKVDPRSLSNSNQYTVFKVDGTSSLSLSKVPMSPQDSLRARFVGQIRWEINSALYFFAPSAPYLSFLPPRIGYSSILDNAIECICFSQISRSNESLSRKKYIKALKSLQEGLRDEKTSRATETLGAVMLLQIIEQFEDKDSLSWVKHAGGAMRLIESRGPQSIRGRLDRAILDGQLGRINFECIREGRASFLDDPSWQHIFELPKDPNSPSLSQMPLSRLEYNRNLSRLPGLLKRYLAWQEIATKSQKNTSVVEFCGSSAGKLIGFVQISLILDVLRFRDECRSWRDKYAEELFWASNKSSVLGRHNLSIPNPSTSKHPTRHVLAIEWSSATLLVIANHMLVQLRHGREFCFQDKKNTSSIDREVDSIRIECIYHAMVVKESYAFLSASYPIAAFLLRDSLGIAWQKVTELHFQPDHCCNDPILNAVGCLL